MDDFDPLFAALEADPQGALDGVRDKANQPREEGPKRVRDDFNLAAAQRPVMRS